METKRYHFTTIDSTNKWARQHIDELDKDSLTFISADEQTAGRGRFQRKWLSPANQNVYATFAFFCDKNQADIGNISQVMAVCAADVLEQLGFSPECKWPNDLLLSKKKVGGILCEVFTCPTSLFVIAGIGVNVNMSPDIISEIDQPATSLQMERGRQYLVEIVLELLEHRFRDALKLFIGKGKGFKPFFQKFQELLVHRPNQTMRFHDNQRLWEGTFHSLLPDGSIAIQLPTGEVKSFKSGELTK